MEQAETCHNGTLVHQSQKGRFLLREWGDPFAMVSKGLRENAFVLSLPGQLTQHDECHQCRKRPFVKLVTFS